MRKTRETEQLLTEAGFKRPASIPSFKSWNLVTKKVLSEVECAYAAGFWDGEGTISIWNEKRAANRDGIRLKITMTVANTDYLALEDLRAIIGNGRITVKDSRKGNAGHKTLYRLDLTSNQIRHVLPQLLPYLIIKKYVASTVLKYLEMLSPGKKFDDPGERRAAFRLMKICQALNAKGSIQT